MKSPTTVTDPVCGIVLDTTAVAGRTEYNGQKYYFCGSRCKEKFDPAPEQYTAQLAGTPERGHGCKHCLFNYLYPHHMEAPAGCSISRTLRHFTHPFGRAMETQGKDN